jgi:transcriptional regulator with XRE-family HTH domain
LPSGRAWAPVAEVFPRRLAQAREAKGWTKAELLRQVGREGRSNATGWEKGILPDADTTRTLALKLGVTIDWLYGRDLLQEDDPRDPFDLSAPHQHLAWRGRPLSSEAHRRAYALLHALLAPLDELPYPQAVHKEKLSEPANPASARAQHIADVLAPGREGSGDAGDVGEVDPPGY